MCNDLKKKKYLERKKNILTTMLSIMHQQQVDITDENRFKIAH